VSCGRPAAWKRASDLFNAAAIAFHEASIGFGDSRLPEGKLMASGPPFDDSSIDTSKLGSLRAEYPAGSFRHKLAIGAAATFILLLAGVAAFIILRNDPRDGPNGRLLATAFFGFLMILPLIGLVVLVRRLTWRVSLFANGLVLHKKNSVQVVLWEDVKYLYEKRLIQYGAETDHTIRIETDGGDRLRLDALFQAITPLADAIRQCSNPVLLAKAKRKLQNGEPVSFGPLKLAPDGLENGKHKISWTEVEAPNIEKKGPGHHLVIRKSGKRSQWYSCPIPDFPNIEVFLTLVSGLAQVGK